MSSQKNNEVAEVAKQCPTHWQIARGVGDGTYYCTPPDPDDPDDPDGELIAHWLGISIFVVVVMLLLLRARR